MSIMETYILVISVLNKIRNEFILRSDFLCKYSCNSITDSKNIFYCLYSNSFAKCGVEAREM